MNYGYSQQYGGMGRYGQPMPMYQAPTMAGPSGPSGLQRYAQGMDRNIETVRRLREMGATDDDLIKAGFQPDMEESTLSQYGGLLNQRNEMRQDLQQDVISGIGKGAQYLGKAL